MNTNSTCLRTIIYGSFVSTELEVSFDLRNFTGLFDPDIGSEISESLAFRFPKPMVESSSTWRIRADMSSP